MYSNETSKYISFILRHKPEAIGNTLDELSEFVENNTEAEIVSEEREIR